MANSIALAGVYRRVHFGSTKRLDAEFRQDITVLTSSPLFASEARTGN